jgi:hypothetical protein
MPLSAKIAASAALATLSSPVSDVAALSASRRTLSYMVAKRKWKV